MNTTASAAQPTAGPWHEFNTYEATVPGSAPDQVRDKNGGVVAWIRKREHSHGNARLIAEAGTVASETGLSPRQLLAQRDELAAFHQKLSGLLIAAEGDDLCEVVENICNQRDKLLAALGQCCELLKQAPWRLGYQDDKIAESKAARAAARAAIRSVKPA